MKCSFNTPTLGLFPLAHSVEQRTFNPLGLSNNHKQIPLRTTTNPYFMLRQQPMKFKRHWLLPEYEVRACSSLSFCSDFGEVSLINWHVKDGARII